MLLTDLPEDVMFIIYDWLRVLELPERPSNRTWQPVNRALLAYTQSYRFHTVHLRSSKSLKLLVDTVFGLDRWGSSIKRLTIGGLDGQSLDVADGLDQLWARLTAVRFLRFDGWTTCLLSFLTGYSRRLESIQSLELLNLIPRQVNPYDRSLFDALTRVAPHLEALEVTLHPRYTSQSPTANNSLLFAVEDVPRAVSGLRTLVVRSYDANQNEALAAIVNSFRGLTRLELGETYPSTTSARGAILPLLSLPQLATLFYTSGDSGVRWGPNLVELELAHLTTLSELKIDLRGSNPNLRLHLPADLQSLDCAETDISLVELTELVTPGPRQLTHLERMNLDAIDGDIGTVISGTIVPDLREPDYEPHADWWLPEWTNNVPREGLLRFAELATERGVELTGTAVHALEVQAQADNDMTYLEGLRGL